MKTECKFCKSHDIIVFANLTETNDLHYYYECVSCFKKLGKASKSQYDEYLNSPDDVI